MERRSGWGSRIEGDGTDKRSGASRIRTGDIRLAKTALYQLSYGPVALMVGMPSRFDLGSHPMTTDQSTRTTETPKDQPAEVSNWDIVNHYFDIATDRLDLRDDVAAVMRSSYREVQVQI